MHSTAVERLIQKATTFLTEFHQETGAEGLSERIISVDTFLSP
jgi:hypothetical protein